MAKVKFETYDSTNKKILELESKLKAYENVIRILVEELNG